MNESFNYVKNYTSLISQKLKNNESVLLKHSVPHLFLKNEKELHKVFNQLILAESNYTQNTLNQKDVIEKKIKVNYRPILLSEKKENVITYNFFYKDYEKKILFKKINIKAYYDFSSLSQIMEYYFTCAINSEPYSLILTSSQLQNLINIIDKKPYQFSKIVNQTFNKLRKEIWIKTI